jgi:putative hydroxymethylpyrimidine transport system ATP-binding protein
MEDQPVVLLDEPFSALDAVTRAGMQELAAQVLVGRTVLLVTHDPAEATRLGHSIQIMKDTGITAFPPPSGTPPRGSGDLQALLAYSVEKLKDFRAGVSYTIWLNGFVMPLF